MWLAVIIIPVALTEVEGVGQLPVAIFIRNNKPAFHIRQVQIYVTVYVIAYPTSV